MASPHGIKTRILILSDTHGHQPLEPRSESSEESDESEVAEAALSSSDEDDWVTRLPIGFREPLPEADVAIHCGDLTKYSSVSEFERSLETMHGIQAPLKLVIAGNHDLALDNDYNLAQREPGRTTSVAHRIVMAMMREAATDGLRYLVQGTHSFTLTNGARLTVYASPFTPKYGEWAFQYANGKHDFDIPPGVDIVMTHGPPRGILDYALNKEHAGCNTLFQAIHTAKPKVHCFGHIHEAWGCYLASWKHCNYSAALSTAMAGVVVPVPTSENSIDADKSRLSTLHDLRNMGFPVEGPFAVDTLGRLVNQQAVHVDLTREDSRLETGTQTLFVNASICDVRYQACQRPFLVDVYLDEDDGQEELQYESADALIEAILTSRKDCEHDDDASTSTVSTLA